MNRSKPLSEFVFCLLLFVALLSSIVNAQGITIQSAGLALIEEASISPTVPGLIESIQVQPGDVVKTGDLLVRMDATEQRLELRRLEIELLSAKERAGNDVAVRSAQKELELAELELKRARQLNEKFENTISDSQVERLELVYQNKKLEVELAKLNHRLARMLVDSAKQSVEAAAVRVERCVLRAPRDGIVVEVNHKAGEWAQMGKALCRIVSVNELRAEGAVDPSQLGADLRSGQKALFEMDVPGLGVKSYEGVVTFVSPEANPVNGTVKIHARIRNQDGRLRAGYLGKLNVHVEGNKK